MNIRILSRRAGFFLPLALALLNTAATLAQEVPNATVAESTSAETLAIEQVERALADLEQSSSVAVDVKFQAIDNYKAALKNLQSAAASDLRLQALIADTETVAQRTEQFKKQRAELKDKKPTLESGLPLQDLEQLLPPAELQLSAFKKSRLDAETELQTRSPRRKEIRAKMTEIQEKITDAQSQLRALASVEPTPQNQSLTARLASRRISLEKERSALEAELAKYDAEESADLVRLRIDLAISNAAYTDKLIALLQERINVAREVAAEESVRKARYEAISAAPALKVYAEENQLLAEMAKSIAEELAATEAQLKASTEVHDGLIRQFAQTRKKVDSVGLTSSVGALLRKQRTTLPDVNVRRNEVANRQKLLNDTQYQLFEYEEAHQELARLDDTIKTILDESKSQATQNDAVLESAARDLMTRKQEYLQTLIRSSGQYFDTLVELDTVDQQVISLVAQYENYIDQRVLWIRSGPALSSGVQLHESDSWLISTEKWTEYFGLLASDAKSHLVVYMFFLAAVGLLLTRGRALRSLIAELGETAQKANCRSIGPTLRVLFLTSIVSLAWPLLCIFIGWRSQRFAGESEFTSMVGEGFKVLGIVWASLEWMRQACRSKGIGESHFRWPGVITNAFRREVKLFIAVALPIVFVTATLASKEGAYERGGLQRIAFMLGAAVACIVLFRLLRPKGMLREYLGKNDRGWVEKLKYLIPIAGVSVPLSLAALAAAGYFYTAQTLFWRLFATCLFVASLIVIRSVLNRMLLLRRRYLSMEQARQRAVAAKAATDSPTQSQPVAGIVTENPQADISAHSLQSRRLVSTGMTAISLVGLWMIWIQVLPALGMLGNYPMWGKASVSAVTTAAATPMPALAAPAAPSAGGASASTTATVTAMDESAENVVTLSDLALAVLIVVVTVVLSRNGPGLLEMSVLQQLPFDASVRYAITTLVSYAIVMIGIITACSTIGLQWSQIQWLATALTFGLAFGLQEMFANFVAGLIILLERPIRVGDIVTVDDVTGVVSRIRIRATSITNWDRKEYVVPNKEFITGRLLNWTLSDKVNRVVVQVGLAYGSDTEHARELLLKVANAHPLVMKDPASMASFEGFGDNSLNLVLRTFLPSLENRLQVIHDLHTAIDQEFRKAGIEIAFPQRDLHIRTVTGVADLGLQIGNEQVTEKLRDVA